MNKKKEIINDVEKRKNSIKGIAQGLRQIADEIENRKVTLGEFNISYDVREKVTDRGEINYAHSGYATLHLEYCIEDKVGKYLKWIRDR